MTVLRIAAVAVCLLAVACSEPAPTFQRADVEVRPVDIADRSRYSIAWIAEDLIAISTFEPDTAETTGASYIALARTDGTEGRLAVPERPECLTRDFMTLALLPTGELGLADVCDAGGPTETAEFFSVDLEDGAWRSLGRAADRPFNVSWRRDLTAVYSTPGSLCETLYEHGQVDRPLDLEVEVRGQRFSVGYDVARTPDDLAKPEDRCPSDGRAAHPAHSPIDERLAFMATGNGGAAGMDLIDRPWAILLETPDGPVVLFDGVYYPRAMVWSPDGSRLLFAGDVAGETGLWSLDPEGGELVQLTGHNVFRVAVSPDGTQLAAILQEADPSVNPINRVVILDLPDAPDQE